MISPKAELAWFTTAVATVTVSTRSHETCRRARTPGTRLARTTKGCQTTPPLLARRRGQTIHWRFRPRQTNEPRLSISHQRSNCMGNYVHACRFLVAVMLAILVWADLATGRPATGQAAELPQQDNRPTSLTSRGGARPPNESPPGYDILVTRPEAFPPPPTQTLSLIHISEPTRLGMI